MQNASDYQANIANSIEAIGRANWDACSNPSGGCPMDPFTTFRFLSGLEKSGSVGSGTGWHPQYIQILLKGETVAVAPCFAKTHSQGEYIFDHNFAHAYEGAGGRYYPKLQNAVPFTPATGRRLLSKDPNDVEAQTMLLAAMKQLADQNEWSSAHITFCTKAEQELGLANSFLPRLTQQYHWHNQDYKNFEDFLSALSSRKRKNIRKERLGAQKFGGTIEIIEGRDTTEEHWQALWAFYQDTGARKWGTPYLTHEFFEYCRENLRDDVVLFMCKRNGNYIAGALNFKGKECLYGRYWGCVEDHRFLHFEICYYQAIEYAIDHGLGFVEAGAQGEHKLARGYLPQQTYSMHYFPNSGFSDAVEKYLKAERAAVGQDITVLTQFGPFKSNKEDENGQIA